MAASSPRKILYYRNPMGLPDTSPEPKKDSMGMDYIPVCETTSRMAKVRSKVSRPALQTLGVKTAMAEMRAMDAERAGGRPGGDQRARAIHDVAPRFEAGSSAACECQRRPGQTRSAAVFGVAPNWCRRKGTGDCARA